MIDKRELLEKARERLIAEFAGIELEEREELLYDYLLRFLEYIGIIKEDIEKEQEAQDEVILTDG